MPKPEERRPPPFALVEYSHRVWLIVTFVYAAMHLWLLRNADLGVVLLFLLPPICASLMLASSKAARQERLACRLFLVFIATAIIIAKTDAILPNLPQQFPGLPLTEDRILTLYMGIYLFFVLIFLPPYIFVNSLLARAQGKPTILSRFTCYSGIVTWIFLLFGLLWGMLNRSE